jgi:hypothetical protein
MSTIDCTMFGKSWWSLPLGARCASVDALLAGIAVSVEMVKHFDYFKPYPCIVWHGTTDQFQATKIFARGIVAKLASGRHVAFRQLRGTVYPDGDGRFRFVIKCCYIDGRRDIKLLADEALADERYLNFRDAVMAGFPMAEDGVGEA